MVNRKKVVVLVGRFWSCLFFLCAISAYAYGQIAKNVSGVIKDAAGEPIIGVNVVLKGAGFLIHSTQYFGHHFNNMHLHTHAIEKR